jgi:hypothetical protein
MNNDSIMNGINKLLFDGKSPDIKKDKKSWCQGYCR